MWEFLSRLLAVAIPAIRDFRGVPNKLDGSGNYNIGIADYTIFPEISLESSKRTMGLDISIVTSAENDADAHELLRLVGFPFRRTETAAPKATAA
jgi:large subunit ribosomal protein L5